MSRFSTALAFLLLVPSPLVLSACSNDDDPPFTSARVPETTTASTPRSTPPHLVPLEIPDWPPFGPQSTLNATCTGAALSNITASFTNAQWNSASGAWASTAFTGRELGEGQGRLQVRCCDSAGSCAERAVEKFLVDLTPPEVATDRLVASPSADGFDGEISFWVSDAWVLGAVELSFRGTTLRHDFPSAYPSTVGKDWDVSRVAFAAKDLPVGSGPATVIVRDAAGNATTAGVALRIDDTAPAVSVLQPTAGALVGGPFVVRVSSVDTGNPTPTALEVFVGGALVGELVGPVGELTVDPSTLPPGSTTIRVVARDDAGNESSASTVVQIK